MLVIPLTADQCSGALQQQRLRLPVLRNISQRCTAFILLGFLITARPCEGTYSNGTVQHSCLYRMEDWGGGSTFSSGLVTSLCLKAPPAAPPAY